VPREAFDLDRKGKEGLIVFCLIGSLFIKIPSFFSRLSRQQEARDFFPGDNDI